MTLEHAVQRQRALDEPQVRERLWDVAEMFAIGAKLLGVEPDMVGIDLTAIGKRLSAGRSAFTRPGRPSGRTRA
jgi:hypothetical protein